MSCDIISWVEVCDADRREWKAVLEAFPADAFEKEHHRSNFVSSPFRDRHYGLFGFLADVRNWACCKAISMPRGFPPDFDLEGGFLASGCYAYDEGVPNFDGYHSHSWLKLAELLNFDYEKVFWNRRIRGPGGLALAREGEGVHETYRSFLGRRYFESLDVMAGLGAPDCVRVVFCFGD
jgi:hypothetical protein